MRPRRKGERSDPCTYCVYFVLSPTINRVKIGFSTQNPNERIASFSAGCAEPLIPLGIIVGRPGLERSLHLKFQQYRRHGEWFEYSDEIKDYVKEHAGPWPDPKASFVWSNLITVREDGIDRGDGQATGKVVGYEYWTIADVTHPEDLLPTDPDERERVYIENELVNGKKPTSKKATVPDSEPCPECAGQGTTPFDGQCPACGGTGLAADS
jgi:hypothetical protein